MPEISGQLDGDQTTDWTTDVEITGKQHSLQSVPTAGLQFGLSEAYDFHAGTVPAIQTPSTKYFQNHATEKDKAMIRWWSGTLQAWRTSYPELIEQYVMTVAPTYSEGDLSITIKTIKSMVISFPGEVEATATIPWHKRLHAMDDVLDHNGSAIGDIIFGSVGTAGKWDKLAGNAVNTKKFLRSWQSGGALGAPSWQQIDYADISGTLTHKLKWLSGGTYTDDQPQTPAGKYWYCSDILQPLEATSGTPATVPAGEVWHVNEATCLEPYAVAGYIDFDSTGTGVLFTDSVGDNVTVTIVNGLVTVPATGTIYGVDTETGNTVALAIQGDGTVTGFTGEIQVTDADSGDTTYLRVTSAGHITQ